ncbi:MAG: methionyl-tRNA formyltransferase [Patescibacteria group bacterium]|nr:methionyl-tRNA formyltransferase [Patescibacteria group bacterium]
MKLVFFGSSGYVISVIEKLKQDFEIELVVTTDKTDGPVPKFCVEKKLPYISVTSLSEPNTKYKILNTKSELAVLADFGLILPSDILNKFKYGILNIHPSLLPKYRGPTPVQSAILNNEKETGVSIIKLDEKMDHGDILAQAKEKIRNDDTAQSLYKRLFEIGGNLLYQNIKQYIRGELKLTEQNHKNATFTKILTRSDGYFDLDNPPSPEKLDLMVKAYYPWPGAYTKFRIQNSEFRIKFLPEKKLQVEGKRPVSYKDFINGYPNLDKRLLVLLK